MIYLLAGIIISMGFSQTEGMLPLHFDNEMKERYFGTNNPYPYLMALNGLLVVLFQFQISKWVTDKPVGKTMLYGACLFGIGLFFIGWLPKWFGGLDTNATIILITLLFVYAIYTLGEMIMSPVQMTFVANLAPEHLRGLIWELQVCSGLQEVHSAHFLEVFIRPITWPLSIYNFSCRLCSCRYCIYFFRPPC